MDTALDRRLAKIERMLTELLKEKEKAVWIKSSQVMELTGWDKEKMRRMRDNGVIVHKHTDTGHWYDLNSIPKQFLKLPS